MPKVTTRQARILIVDDDINTVTLLENVLAKAGYRNLWRLMDSSKVIRRLEELDADLLILDLLMPAPDGFALLEQLAQKNVADDHFGILVVTGSLSSSTRLKAIALGAGDLLTKPVDRIDLLVRIRNLLIPRMMWREGRQNSAGPRVLSATEPDEVDREMLHRMGILAACIEQESDVGSVCVSAFAARIASTLGWNENEAESLRAAARVYHVGLLAVAPEIRRETPGRKLTAEERVALRRHTELGAQMFNGSQLPGLVLARDIALHHHEHWDGSGYPAALRGDEIPLAARIVSVADAYCRLLNAPVPLNPEQARAEIARQSGYAFDPAVVGALGQMILANPESARIAC